jgi:tRNA modification GTPase
VRDLVHARTLYQARVAFAQADGAIARSIEPLRESLEDWIVRAEAAVEFVDEAETHLPAGSFGGAIAGTRRACAELLQGFSTGRVVRDGASLVVVGRPNAGKSSLFNKLLARERAIVTSIAGTTRDTLEEELDLDGIPVRLVDTAGLRPVTDPVESEGVRRARQAREEADLVLLMLDGSRDPDPVELEAVEQGLEETEAKRTVIVVNKLDLERKREGSRNPHQLMRVSALTGEGLDALRGALKERLVGAGPLEDPIITNARHAAALEGALAALDRAAQAHAAGVSEELVLEDLRQAMRRLGEICGEFTTEDLYDRIFSTFCIGK